MAHMATTTATPLDTKAEAKAAKKKKEPKPSFNERWLDKKGWGRRFPLLPALVFIIILTQIPFIATLIISFMNWEANYPNEIAFGTLNNYVQVFTDPALRSSVFFTIVLTLTVVLVSLALGLGISLLLNRNFFGRGIVRTFMITPFSDRAGSCGVAVETRHLQPRLRPTQRPTHLGRRPTARLDHRLPPVRDRSPTDLVLDPVHDPDPAGRAAVPPR